MDFRSPFLSAGAGKPEIFDGNNDWDQPGEVTFGVRVKWEAAPGPAPGDRRRDSGGESGKASEILFLKGFRGIKGIDQVKPFNGLKWRIPG